MYTLNFFKKITIFLILIGLFFLVYRVYVFNKTDQIILNTDIIFRNDLCKRVQADAVFEIVEGVAKFASFKDSSSPEVLYSRNSILWNQKFKWNFVDESGKKLSNLNFDLANDFIEGYAVVMKNREYFFIDKTGKNAFGETYDDAHHFSEGYAVVRQDEKYFFIDEEGKKVFDQTYEGANSFSQSYAVVMKDGEYFFIDKTGENVFGETYDQAYDFSEGYAVVAQDGTYFLLDSKGNKKLLYSSEEWLPVFVGISEHTALFYYYIHDFRSYFFINLDGYEVTDKKFYNADNFNEGLALVQGRRSILTIFDRRLNKSWYFIDKNGKKVSEKYNWASNYNDDIAVVKKWNKYYYINKDGVKIFKDGFDYASPFYQDIAYVVKDGDEYFIMKNGEVFCE